MFPSVMFDSIMLPRFLLNQKRILREREVERTVFTDDAKKGSQSDKLFEFNIARLNREDESLKRINSSTLSENLQTSRLSHNFV